MHPQPFSWCTEVSDTQARQVGSAHQHHAKEGLPRRSPSVGNPREDRWWSDQTLRRVFSQPAEVCEALAGTLARQRVPCTYGGFIHRDLTLQFSAHRDKLRRRSRRCLLASCAARERVPCINSIQCILRFVPKHGGTNRAAPTRFATFARRPWDTAAATNRHDLPPHHGSVVVSGCVHGKGGAGCWLRRPAFGKCRHQRSGTATTATTLLQPSARASVAARRRAFATSLGAPSGGVHASCGAAPRCQARRRRERTASCCGRAIVGRFRGGARGWRGRWPWRA